MPRFALLEHTGAPDDPAGRHFDLLLEDVVACRTWRLLAIPQPGGPAVAALELPPHRLAWLDILEGEVSGGRGHARRVAAGEYAVLAADAATTGAATSLVVRVQGGRFSGRLRLEQVAEGWAVGLAYDGGNQGDSP
ncbi:MAG: hypothetical protein ACK54F_09800 [Planctomycetia bacterium]|jgi:hypothetical protein